MLTKSSPLRIVMRLQFVGKVNLGQSNLAPVENYLQPTTRPRMEDASMDQRPIARDVGPTQEYYYRPESQISPQQSPVVPPEQDQRTVPGEEQSYQKRPSVTRNTESIRTRTVNVTTQTDSTGRQALPPQYQPAPPTIETREMSQDQYRLTRVQEQPSLPPDFEQLGSSTGYYPAPRQRMSENHTRGIQPGALSKNNVAPQQHKQGLPNESYSKQEGHAHHTALTDPLPPRKYSERTEPPQRVSPIQHKQPEVDPRLDQEVRRMDYRGQQTSPSDIRYEDNQILIDEPDNYPPLHSSGVHPESDRRLPGNFSDESTGKQEPGMRGDPRSYYNEHMRRNTAKAKQINDLHSAQRSHSRKQDQVIQSLQEEKEALRKLLHKMINENLRRDSARNSRQASPERSSSKDRRDKSFESQKKTPSVKKSINKDALPTKKKETKPASSGGSMSRDGRQGMKPPKSKTRQDNDRPSRYDSPKKETSTNGKRRESADKNRPLLPKNTNTRQNHSPQREHSPRKLPFDIPKGADRTEYTIMEPYLDRYGGRIAPQNQRESKYSPTKNPFLRYPPPEVRRNSESPDENRYNLKEYSVNAYRPAEKERKNCLYCVHHEDYLGHQPRANARPAHQHSPGEVDSRKRGALTFAPQEEYFFEGKVYLSPSNSPPRHY